MFAKIRLSLTSFAVLSTLMLGAVITAPVLADDEAPPPPEAPVVIDPAASGESVPAAPAGDPGSTSAPALTDGTELVVLDESGNAVPLASESAAEIIASGDPIWCPTGVTPDTLNPACSGSFVNLAALVAGFVPTANGVIWIEHGADSSGGAILINGLTTWGPAKTFALTLKGGWSGTMGTTTTNPLTPSAFSQSITISSWQADVTISEIVISGAGADGLTVYTTKNISLTRVNSNNNTGSGAILSNTAGTGKVTISTGQFNQNAGTYGLQVSSRGAIIASNLTASQNSAAGYGAQLSNAGSPTPMAVTLTGGNSFNANYRDGLIVYSDGTISGNDITATGNGLSGLGGGGATFINSYPGDTAGVTLTGLNIFTDNYDTGLHAVSNGPIKLNNVIANSNYGVAQGAILDNSSAVTAQPVTLTGSSQFNYNKAIGLYVTSKGLVTLNNVVASGSQTAFGLSVNQCVFDGFACSGSPLGGLKLTGTNVFNNNFTSGLNVGAVGALTLNNVTARGNGASFGYGANLDNSEAVSPKGVTLTGNNLFDGNYNEGLYIYSKGLIKVSNLTATNGAHAMGAQLSNAIPGGVGGVILSGTNLFADNYSTGLSVNSYGAITLNQVTASGNGLASGSGYGVSVGNSGALTPQPVTLSGVNFMSGNRDTGLYVLSTGAIKVNSLTSTGNVNGGGAYLDSTLNSASSNAITLSGTNVFTDNHSHGLQILVAGAVAMSNMTVSDNHNMGIWVTNTASTALSPRNVSLTGLNTISGNWSTGLDIESYGSIALNNVTAIGNGVLATNGTGAYLDNSTGSLPRGVTLTGTNVFNDSYYDGLDVTSLGAIKISNLTASGNGIPFGSGASLVNDLPGAVGGVTLSGSNYFIDNHDDGLSITSLGAIAMSNLHASDNGWSVTNDGVLAYNYTAVTAVPVTITGTNVFNGNFGNGLLISSNGVIKASNVTANDNHFFGTTLSNSTGLSTAGVTLTGVTSFNDNYQGGLYVASMGAINLLTTSLTANGNGPMASSGYGVSLTNSSAPTPMPVKLTGISTFNGNYNDGLNLYSIGAITLGNLTANNNTHGNGAFVQNSAAGVGAVILTGSNVFSGNYSSGLNIHSNGAIAVNNLTANQNGLASGTGEGANLLNNSAAAPQAVKLTGTNAFSGNRGNGLFVNSLGAITVNNLTASHSTSAGGAILKNDNLGAVGSVTLTGVSNFLENNGNGLQVLSLGAVSLTKSSADGNNSDGLQVTTTGNITLTCGSFVNNITDGVDLNTPGTASLIGVFASGNGGSDTELTGAGTVITVRNCPLP